MRHGAAAHVGKVRNLERREVIGACRWKPVGESGPLRGAYKGDTMLKFHIRFVQKIPVWAYAEVEAETLDDALDMLEENSERYIYEVDRKFDEAPGLPEDDFVFAEYEDAEKNWKSAV